MSTNQSLPLSSTHIHSPTTLSSSTSSTFPHAPVPTEIEATLSRLSAYRNVRGAMILSRRSGEAGGEDNRKAGIIQSIGAIFEGEGGRRYAKALEGVVASVGGAVGECDEGDELKFLRIRTKRHELIITPDEKYLLVVLQDPGQ